MTPLLSVFLDLVRFCAALAVMLDHVWPLLAPRFPLPWPGHQAVVVFFVISGFVIAYVADGKEKTLSDYALHRAARIWSVAVPALVLGALVSTFVRSSSIPDVPLPPVGLTNSFLAVVANLAFLGQVWSFDIAPPLDPPYWSLNYEVWYYAIFGAWTYLHGNRRIATVILLAFACGPKILLMLPCWLLGVYAYRHPPAYTTKAAITIFCATVLAYLVLFQTDFAKGLQNHMTVLWPALMLELGGSNKFVGDFILAVVISANFGAVRKLDRYGVTLLRFSGPIRKVASYTFSIYLYHVPILILLWDGLGWHQPTFVLPLCLGIFLMGYVTERNLPWFRELISFLVSKTIPGRLTGRGKL